MNEKTLQLLEFDAIRSSVAALSLSEEAGNIILGENPLLNIEEAEKLKSLVEAVHERLVSLGGESRLSLPGIGQLFSKLEVEGMALEVDEAYAIGIFIQRAETFRQWLLKPMPEEDSLAKAAGEIPGCNEIAADVFKILDHEGKLRDLPEFREIRKKIRSLQKDIESTGARYAKNEETRRMLQSEIPSQRDGRMVIAVKANFRGRIPGIVHEVSASGQTIFVEPEDVV